MNGRIRLRTSALAGAAMATLTTTLLVPARAEAAPAPPSESLRVHVNCAAGETVSSALATVVLEPRPIVVTIDGVCAERVVLERDDVRLEGAARGSGLTSPVTGGGSLLFLDGARRVTLYQLTLTAAPGGHDTALELVRGAQAQVRNAVVEGASAPAILLFDGALAEVFDSEVRNTSAPVPQVQVTGASLQLFGSKIANGRGTGVSVGRGGSFLAQDSTFSDHRSSGVSVSENSTATLVESEVIGNRFGVSISQNATVQLAGPNRIADNAEDGISAASGAGFSVGGGTVIENNRGNGVSASGGSNVQVANVAIRNNGRSGIWLGDASVLSRAGDTSITGHAQWGISCAPPPAVPQVPVGFPAAAVTGNAYGATNCPPLGTAGQVP